MKSLLLSKSVAVVGAFFLASNLCPAQFGAPSSPAGVNSELARLFGDVPGFSARCELRVLDQRQKETMFMPMDFAWLDGKIRVEVDMTKVKSKELAREDLEGLKQAGMNRTISLVRPDQKRTVQVFPGLKAALTIPMSREEAEALGKEPTVQKTELGKETIDGHPCVKNKVVITDTRGRTHESVLWNAQDLNGFPVQIQSREDGATIMMLFKQVQLSKPAAAQFEIPSDYKQYDNMQAFSQAIVAKMMGGTGAR